MPRVMTFPALVLPRPLLLQLTSGVSQLGHTIRPSGASPLLLYVCLIFFIVVFPFRVVVCVAAYPLACGRRHVRRWPLTLLLSLNCQRSSGIAPLTYSAQNGSTVYGFDLPFPSRCRFCPIFTRVRSNFTFFRIL